jgi:hypothetical protein
LLFGVRPTLLDVNARGEERFCGRVDGIMIVAIEWQGPFANVIVEIEANGYGHGSLAFDLATRNS